MSIQKRNDRIMAVAFFSAMPNNNCLQDHQLGHNSTDVCPSTQTDETKLTKIMGWYQELDPAGNEYTRNGW